MNKPTLTCLILIIINFIKNKLDIYTIRENYENKEKKNNSLSDEQIKEVTGIASQQANTIVTNKLHAGKFIAGPRGPSGEKGPPGGSYQALGAILHIVHSFDKEGNVDLAMSRTVGTIPNKSVVYLDKRNARSYQTWYLTSDGKIRNRYDNSCITANTDPTNINDLVYMGSCDDDSVNNTFVWDADNRLVLKNSGGNKPLKCLQMTQKPIRNKNTTSKPRCTEKLKIASWWPKHYLKTAT